MKQLFQFLVALIVIAVVLILPLLSIWGNWLGLPGTWLGTAVIFAIVLALAGLLTPHRSLLGILVNKENRLSFSRLQMLCWWVLLVSAVLVVAGARYDFATMTTTEGARLAACTKGTPLAEVKPDNASDLDKGNISKVLRETFRDKDKPLASWATVMPGQVASRWIIVDDDRYYFIRGEGEVLTVYDALNRECAELNMSFEWSFKNNWLAMSIPDGLLAAAGLSIGAAIVTGAINSVKRNPSAKQAHDLDRQLRRLQEKKVALTGATQKELLSVQIDAYTPANRHGFLKVADRPALVHLVLGSEVGNWEDVDWSKVQALLLSAMLLVLYGIAVWRMLSDPSQWIASETVSFPAFSGALAALLAVSLAGHEANKLPNHSIIDPADS